MMVDLSNDNFEAITRALNLIHVHAATRLRILKANPEPGRAYKAEVGRLTMEVSEYYAAIKTLEQYEALL